MKNKQESVELNLRDEFDAGLLQSGGKATIKAGKTAFCNVAIL